MLACPQEMRREFGSDPISFYSADTFNEMLPPRSEPAFLSNISAAVYSVSHAVLTAQAPSWPSLREVQ